MSADLAADTRPERDAAGRYVIALPDHWDYLLPSGGVAMTCAMRVAEAALGDPLMRLASATTIFATPIHPGKLVAEAFMIRRGKSAAQLRVALKHAEAPADDENVGLEMLVTFLRDRKGPDVMGVAFPSVRSLADSPPAEDDRPNNPHARFRFYHQLECRIAEGEKFWSPDWTAGPARYARWLRYKAPQRDAQGRFDRLALPPLIDTMPTALHRAIGPGTYRFYAPSLDLTTYFVDDTLREWLLVEVTVRRALMGWAIADVNVWDDEQRFIAYGSQAMYLHHLSGEPPTVDASRR
jgi:acyl-coenzyme A thioesterase PaaI-like protein